MFHKCSMTGCKSVSTKDDKAIKNAVSFFEYPSSPTRKQKWLNNIGKPNIKTTRSTRICSLHFDKKYLVRKGDQTILKKDAVPLPMSSDKLNATSRITPNSSRKSLESKTPEISVVTPRQRALTLSKSSEKIVSSNNNNTEKTVGIVRHSHNSSKNSEKSVTFNNNNIEKPVEMAKRVANSSNRSENSTQPNNNKRTLPSDGAEPNNTIKRRRNTVFIGTYNFGVKKRTNRTGKKQIQPILPSSQLRIENYFSKKVSEPFDVTGLDPDIEDCIFGWTEIGPNVLPFIVQDSIKYCALRIIDQMISTTFNGVTPIIGSCGENVASIEMTINQRKLFNEINLIHCDRIYGTGFYSCEKLVRLSDAEKYFTFVDLCHKSLMNGERVQSKGLPFGFTVVNKKSYIPYIVATERKFIPLVYLHCNGEILEMLKSKCRLLSGDEALFMKFCCKFDGIVDVGDTMEVIDLADVQHLLPKRAKVEYCWPMSTENYRLFVTQTTKGLKFEYIDAVQLAVN